MENLVAESAPESASHPRPDPACGALLSITLEPDHCAVGVVRVDAGGARLEDNSVSPESGRDSQQLLSHIDDLLRGAGVSLPQVQTIAFGAGPGGFTRVRVACAVAQGLAFGRNIPLLPVDSMRARAVAALRTFEATTSPARSGWAQVLVLADARMNEIYAGAYRVRHAGNTGTGGPIEELCKPGLMPASQVPQWLSDQGVEGNQPGDLFLLVADDGLSMTPDRDQSGGVGAIQVVRPGALMILRAVHELAMFTEPVTPARAGPIYLREKVALNIEEQAALRESAARAKK